MLSYQKVPQGKKVSKLNFLKKKKKGRNISLANIKYIMRVYYTREV